MARKLRKDGTPDRRFKKNKEEVKHPTFGEGQQIEVEVVGEGDIDVVVHDQVRTDPQTLFNNLLEANNLKLDFDVLEGTIPTKYGVIKLPEKTLVIKASYNE